MFISVFASVASGAMSSRTLTTRSCRHVTVDVFSQCRAVRCSGSRELIAVHATWCRGAAFQFHCSPSCFMQARLLYVASTVNELHVVSVTGCSCTPHVALERD